MCFRRRPPYLCLFNEKVALNLFILLLYQEFGSQTGIFMLAL